MRLVNPDEILERYNWYIDVVENEPDSALAKALNEATDYNDQPGQITLTMEQWLDVLQWLKYGADYHRAKKEEWLAVCADKRLAAQMAGIHDQAITKTAALCKIIEAQLHPAPQTE